MQKLLFFVLLLLVFLISIQCLEDNRYTENTCPCPKCSENANNCCCGGWLGLHCGTRVDSEDIDGEKLLVGNCIRKAFYQCSEIDIKATFKGLCPNCQNNNENPGQDKCLSPTFTNLF
ncbi:uncharacterized protein LOC128960028 [Oppia nitens]|uniref:uncharacterized protein LOC128960028 n=1 Tax=Oppia nitens TaxID=1686743 RepID=UPI0023DBB308|nr:uncharacterized protein LOC128960028 [Oppia nitens]